MAKIHGREYTLKEAATYAVEYNSRDARAWGNLASTLFKFSDSVSIRDPDNQDEGEQEFHKIDILQQAINLAKTRTPVVGKWWMDISLCMSEPGSSEEFDPRPDRLLIRQQSMTKYDCIEKALDAEALEVSF